jgi:hypothetical protein
MTEKKEEKIIAPKKKKLAIVGFAGTRDQAPFDNPEFEIWTVNNLHQFVPRQDRVFEIHQRWTWDGQLHGQPADEHVKFMQNADIPIYNCEVFPDIPRSIRFPLEEMVKEFGMQRTGFANPEWRDGYFTNTISYMIALGIYEKFEVIEIYGVDMAVGTEYNEQRPSCEYYIGIAKGRGIDVRLPAACDLLKNRFHYGFEDDKIHAWKEKVKKTVDEMLRRKLDSDNMIRQQQSVSDKYEGAITAVREMDSRWGEN